MFKNIYQTNIFMVGGSSQPSAPIPVLTPPDAKNTRRSTQTLEVIDLLSEGPIAGIVDSSGNLMSGTGLGKGIYLNDTAVIANNDLFNFRQLSAELKDGTNTQGLFSDDGFNEVEKVVDVKQKLTGPWSWSSSSPSKFNADTSSHDKRKYGSASLDFGTWKGNLDTSNFPEDSAYIHTHTISNTNVDTAIVNFTINQLNDTYHMGTSSAVAAQLGNPRETTLRLQIIRGYFDESNNKFPVGTTSISITATVTKSPYGVSFEVAFPESCAEKRKFLEITKQSYETMSPLVNRDVEVDTIVEVIRNPKLTYPCSAMMAMRFDARTFSSLPQRSYDCKLKIVRIPSNYYPENRKLTLHTQRKGDTTVYDGVWDGTWKWGWSDNPAWVLYDLLINNTYGVGDFIDPSMVDKWTLYEIAQYCDACEDGEFVGINGKPRFRCNMIITDAREAFDFLNEIAAMFRGMTYWMNGGLYFSDDRPKSALMSFTNQDVKNGEFNYSETTKNTRFTVAEIQYNDESDNYKPKIESVEDYDGLSKLGPLITRLDGLGITSREEANRLGKYVLYTAKMEKDSVSFIAGLKSTYLRPGDVFQVSDVLKTIAKANGRILNINRPNHPFNPQEYALVTDSLPQSGTTRIFLAYPSGEFNAQDAEDALSASQQIDRIQHFRVPQVVSVALANAEAAVTGCNALLDISGSNVAVTGLYVLNCNTPVYYNISPPEVIGERSFSFPTFSGIISDRLDIDLSVSGTGIYGQMTYMPPMYLTGYSGLGLALVGDVVGESTQIILDGFDRLVYVDPLGLKQDRLRYDISFAGSGESTFNPSLFKMVGIRETDKNEYEVLGLAYNPNKFTSIDTGYIDLSQKVPDGFDSISQVMARPSTPTDFDLDVGIVAVTGTYANVEWTWEGNITTLSKFLVKIESPNGESAYFDIATNQWSPSLSNPPLNLYSFDLDLSDNIPDGVYGEFNASVCAVGAYPYYNQSNYAVDSATLAVPSSEVLYKKTMIYTMTLGGGSGQYGMNSASGSGSGLLYSTDASLSWTLLDRTGAILSNSTDLLSSPFNIDQTINILSGNGKMASLSEEANYNALSYTLSKARNEAIFGAPSRSFGIQIKTSDLYYRQGLFTGTYMVSNPIPTISDVLVYDANSGVSGYVKLNVYFDNSGGCDLSYLNIYSGLTSGFAPSASNLYKTYGLTPYTSLYSVQLVPGDNHPTGTTDAEYRFPMAFDESGENPSGYMFYRFIPYDSYGSGLLYPIARSGTIKPDTAQQEQIQEAVSAAMAYFVDTTGSTQSITGFKAFEDPTTFNSGINMTIEGIDFQYNSVVIASLNTGGDFSGRYFIGSGLFFN